MARATPAEILPLGTEALLVRFGLTLEDASNRAALGFAAALRAAVPEGVVEVATAPASVLVRFERSRVARADLHRTLLDRLACRADLPALPPRRWRIPATFGGDHGPELAEASTLAGLTPDEAVRTLCAGPVRVLAIGFAPGQPYLGTLPPAWDIPRRTALTAQVPAGALVVAIRQLVLFANASPTGWRWIGRTAFQPFRPGAAEPFPLRAGDEVTFDLVSGEAFAAILADAGPDGGAALDEARA